MKNLIMDSQSINRSISRISNEILERNKGSKGLVFIGILTRGYDIANRIRDKIYEMENIHLPIYSLDISNYRDDIKRTEESSSVNFDFSGFVDGKTVILVDDVIFTGRSVRAALDAIMENDRPKKVQLVCLIDRGHRELPIRPDYIGKNVPTSKTEKISVKITEIDGIDEVTIINI